MCWGKENSDFEGINALALIASMTRFDTSSTWASGAGPPSCSIHESTVNCPSSILKSKRRSTFLVKSHNVICLTTLFRTRFKIAEEANDRGMALYGLKHIEFTPSASFFVSWKHFNRDCTLLLLTPHLVDVVVLAFCDHSLAYTTPCDDTLAEGFGRRL